MDSGRAGQERVEVNGRGLVDLNRPMMMTQGSDVIAFK